MKSLILLSVLALAGCGGATVRVIEYGGGGAAGVVTGAVSGCALQQDAGETFATFTLTYKGEKCEAVISGVK